MRFHPTIERLVEYARRQLFEEGDHSVGDQRSIDRFRWLVRERLRDKLYPYYLRYVSNVLVPCDLDRRVLPVPRSLSFLYYLVRPVRLTAKHGLRQIRRFTKHPTAHQLPRHDQKTPLVARQSRQ
jgi:hypothetical protein